VARIGSEHANSSQTIHAANATASAGAFGVLGTLGGAVPERIVWTKRLTRACRRYLAGASRPTVACSNCSQATGRPFSTCFGAAGHV
jgi:hypothetical protein